MSFAEKLHELRISRNISQKELADNLGVAQSSVNYWEKGQRDPSITMVKKIADYFGISVDEMLEWKPDGTNQKSTTIAAHFENEEFTAEEIKKIKEYAELLKAARPALDKFVEYATTGLDDLLVPDKEETE